MNLLGDRMKYDRKVYLLLNENEKDKYGVNHEFFIKNETERELLEAANKYKKYCGLVRKYNLFLFLADKVYFYLLLIRNLI